MLLLLPLSLPLRLLPGRITINPVTIPPPCSGALSEMILSLPSISSVNFFFFSLFPASGARGVATAAGCVGVSDFFRRDVGSAGGGCFFDGLRLGFSDFVENVGDRDIPPARGLPGGANLVASLVDDVFLLGAVLPLDDFLIDSFLAGGAECRSPDDGCRAWPVATRPEGTSASVFEVRRRCLRGDSGVVAPGPSEDEPEEDDDDEGGGFPFAAGGGPREMGGRHMVVGERALGASRQDSRRNYRVERGGLLDETTTIVLAKIGRPAGPKSLKMSARRTWSASKIYG